jgi:hypothetical protein
LKINGIELSETIGEELITDSGLVLRLFGGLLGDGTTD